MAALLIILQLVGSSREFSGATAAAAASPPPTLQASCFARGRPPSTVHHPRRPGHDRRARGSAISIFGGPSPPLILNHVGIESAAASALFLWGDERSFGDDARKSQQQLGAPPTADAPEDPSLSSSSGCPFSMSFPRYRIDLSSASSVKKRDESRSGRGLGGLFSGLKLGMDKSAVERRYKDDVESGRFRWVDCGVQQRDGDEGDEAVKRGMVGIRAAAAFWRAVADADAAAASLSRGEEVGGRGISRVVLSLPGASALSLLRLADVAAWLEGAIMHGGSAVPGVTGIAAHAEVDEESPVPTVVLTAATPDGTSKLAGASTVEATTVDGGGELLAASDGVVESRIRAWVRRVLVELEICPFTKSERRSGQGLADLGVPTGRIAYHHSKAAMDEIALLLADTWEAIADMMDAGPSGKNGVSSILLAAPAFDQSFALWAGPVFATLEATVSAAGAEPLVGVVCFHPRYATPDGTSWPGFGHMHSVPRLRKWLDEQDGELSARLSDEEVAAGGAWQRRTPHAVINVLRADQLEAAEGRRATGNLYTRNIRVLVGKDDGLGSRQLEDDLIKERSMR